MSDAPVLSPKQSTWLAKLTDVEAGPIALSDKALEMAVQQAEGQKLIEDTLGPERDNIRATFQTVSVKMKAKGLEGAIRKLMGMSMERALMDPGHDPMKDFDTWLDGPDMEGIDESDRQILVQQYTKIIAVQNELKKNAYYAQPEKPELPREPSTPEQRKEYQDKIETYEADLKLAQRRMAEDLWNPLQREGVMPENFIPDEYSEVKRQFDEANALYEERLQEYSKDLGEYGKFLQHFDDAMAIGMGMLSVAGAGAGFAGAMGSLMENKDVVANAKEAQEIIGWMKIAMTSTSGIVKGALKDQDGFAVAEAINGAVGEILGATLDEDTAALTTGLITGAIKASKAGKLFAEGKIEEGLAEIADSISASLGGLGDEEVARVGNIIAASIKALPKAKQAAEKFKDDPTGAMLLLIDGASSMNAAIKGAKSEEAGEVLDELSTDVDLLNDVVNLAKQEKIVSTSIDKEKLKEMQEANAKKQAENFEEFMREEDRDFAEALQYGFADPDDDDEELDKAERKRIDSLERIVAVYKRDEMIFNLAKKIVTGGPKFVADMVPGAGLVAAVTQLVYSIGEAVKHAEQLVIWMDNVADAKKAKTAQLDAMLNRMGLQKKQLIVANIKVGIQAVKVAGEATKLAGQAAPVGYAISAGADLAESVLEVSAKVVEVAEMEKAWKTYKKALENPQSRRLARDAMRQNPTLAKYAMAWGAVEDGNAIAKEAMRRCGLNEKTLAQSETNVGKVVEYLEMIYADDPVLLRAVPVSDKWYPGDIEFEFRGFLKFYRAGTTKAEPKLAAMDFSGVSGALGAYETAAEKFAQAILETTKANAAAVTTNTEKMQEAQRTYREAKAQWEEGGKTGEEPVFTPPPVIAIVDPEPSVYANATDAAAQCILAFGRLTPTDETGLNHESFKKYTDAMEAKARIARTDFDGAWERQDWRPT